ncbi:MAG: RagB/SusD family nutrient uptake outer membrane protein [Pedobacter sp.]|uniref:RagB/SusD family nutrient uptake outer membrane protein n=1 Tax=Pedobacter sp. TaxID=1411316 RepID=UPI0035697886
MKKLIILIIICTSFSCTEKLELKPSSSTILPTTIKDLELILDNIDVMNVTMALPQLSADEYFIPNREDWEALSTATARNSYIWAKDIYEGETKVADWRIPYASIFYCNNVLDILSKKDVDNDSQLKVLKGWALFARSYSFYCLVSTFSKAYNPATASTDLGISLKLSAGIDEIVQRSTVEKTYSQIINDALEAAELLNQNIINGKRNRPSKVAAYAFLARVYISMRMYDKAEIYSDKCLSIYSKLTDFNTLNKTASSAFSYDDDEIIYFTKQISSYSQITYGLSNSYGIDPDLIASYDPSDLRLPIYFRKNTIGNYNTKPINNRSQVPFSGLATDEVYLIKAECLARRDEKDEALIVLNDLVRTRTSGTYTPIIANTAEDVLEKVLTERRKALIWRSLRWTDLKRLNLEGRNITLTRNLQGVTYSLEPNSPRYILPIPDDEIALSGVIQNLR